MAIWLLYALTVAALLGFAAWMCERVVRLAGGPTRFVWATAMVLATVVPPAALATGGWTPGVGLVSLPLDRSVAMLLGAAGGSLAAPEVDAIRSPDVWLAVLWGLTTAVLLVQLGRARARLRRERATWRAAVVDAVPVLISPRTGPATIGARRPEIVLPEVVTRMPAAGRRMIVAHELEHVKARDGLLAVAAFGLVSLSPWNPVLWWMLARLRHALEIDCDRRVLSSDTSVRDYVDLLVKGGVAVDVGIMGGIAFAVRPSRLRRRVTEILRPEPRLRRTRMLSAAVPGVLAACLALLVSPPADRGLRDASPELARMHAAASEADVMLREFAARLRASGRSGDLDRASALAGIRRIEALLTDRGAARVTIDETLRAAELLVREQVGAGRGPEDE